MNLTKKDELFCKTCRDLAFLIFTYILLAKGKLPTSNNSEARSTTLIQTKFKLR